MVSFCGRDDNTQGQGVPSARASRLWSLMDMERDCAQGQRACPGQGADLRAASMAASRRLAWLTTKPASACAPPSSASREVPRAAPCRTHQAPTSPFHFLSSLLWSINCISLRKRVRITCTWPLTPPWCGRGDMGERACGDPDSLTSSDTNTCSSQPSR